MIRPYKELKKTLRFNASKTRRGSIDPPDVFLNMEDILDTLKSDIEESSPSDIESLTPAEIDELTEESV